MYRPFEAKEYRDAVSSLRETIKEHIENRIEESENGKDTPSDVLSHILQLACKSNYLASALPWLYTYMYKHIHHPALFVLQLSMELAWRSLLITISIFLVEVYNVLNIIK